MFTLSSTRATSAPPHLPHDAIHSTDAFAPHLLQIRRDETLGGRRPWFDIQNLAEIANGVAQHGEREPRLARGQRPCCTGNADHKQTACIEDHRHGGEPGDTLVLGAKEGQHRVGEMTF